MRLAALVLLLAAQDPGLEKKLDRIIERFRDDDIEARDGAGRELEAMGMPALPSILRRAEGAEAEIRARLLGAAREIERKDRIAFFLGRPTRITLRADRRPLRELVAELVRHSPMSVTGEGVDLEAPVTVDLKDVPWFEALGRICRAHGSAVPQFQNPYFFNESEPAAMALVKGDPSAARRHVEGAFLVELRGVSTSTSRELGGPAEEHAFLVFDLAWEHGAHPLAASVEVTSVEDGEGRPLEVLPPEIIAEEGIFSQVQTQFDAPFKAPLPAALGTFRTVTGKARLEFPGDVHLSVVEQPAGKKDVVREGPAGFTLRSCTREGKVWKVVYETPAREEEEDDLRRNVRFALVDAKGRIFPIQDTGGSGDGKTMTWTSHVELPAGTEPAEFRAVRFEIDKPRRIVRTIDFKFENVRFR